MRSLPLFLLALDASRYQEGNTGPVPFWKTAKILTQTQF